ncbi:MULTISPECIES: hypothetical protein [unclassified Bradyrhizobium]|uniref:hypothetical protein n=1 Tax=unclassified Bradyrhizobium TaxID=2631580 RepID=UPI001CD5FF4D|nr:MULTISPECIES: hypothetical protein [unclassified Bradyrhizobium]MCA1496925.1 hypothetical protein [Bradyrhizobium sp. NBAIM14]MCA1534012.1 hypothetical protein [Bradyrhizobium sp. NBAIM03]
MADIGKELIFELLKQVELGDVEYKIDEIRSELSACREEQLLMLHDLQVAQSTWSGRRGM